jgi:TonB family protein
MRRLRFEIEAWEHAHRALYGEESHFYDQEPDPDINAGLRRSTARRSVGSCAQPLMRTSAGYPPRALVDGRMGAAIVTYDVTKGGRVENITIEASVGGPDFGARLAKAMERWTFMVMSRGDDDACRKGLRTTGTFVIDD